MHLADELKTWLAENKLSKKEAASWLNVEIETLRGWIYKRCEPSAVDLVRMRMKEFVKPVSKNK